MEPPADALRHLLRNLRPVRNPGVWAFRPLAAGEPVPADAVGSFREAEGWSVVVPAGPADPHPLAWLTLGVESSVADVGLTAAVAGPLAAAGIACNVVAAFRHDHLFVPADRAGDALAFLHSLSAAGGG